MLQSSVVSWEKMQSPPPILVLISTRARQCKYGSISTLHEHLKERFGSLCELSICLIFCINRYGSTGKNRVTKEFLALVYE